VASHFKVRHLLKQVTITITDHYTFGLAHTVHTDRGGCVALIVDQRRRGYSVAYARLFVFIYCVNKIIIESVKLHMYINFIYINTDIIYLSVCAYCRSHGCLLSCLSPTGSVQLLHCLRRLRLPCPRADLLVPVPLVRQLISV
jgi:hypothetical protein